MKLIKGNDEHNKKVKEYVMNKAWEGFQKMSEYNDYQAKILSNKKFHMNDIVVYEKPYPDIIMYRIGRIAGYNTKYNWYHVYFNEHEPYLGIGEKYLHTYNKELYGEIPNDVENYDSYDVKSIMISL